MVLADPEGHVFRLTRRRLNRYAAEAAARAR
jgi:hypothetical protein